MARKKAKKYPSDEVQGEGTWVEMRRPKIGQLKRLMKLQTEEGNLEAFDGATDLLGELIIDWNWTDDDDKPLAKPGNGVSLDDLATDDEIFFLSNLIGEEAQKARMDAKKKPTD